MDKSESLSMRDHGTEIAQDARLDAQAEADFAAGRVVTHARVAAWLRSWGTDNELPCPGPKSA